jgi:hypothetical protein
MFDILFKKKLSESKLAAYFVNSIFHLVETSFEDVVEIIRNDTSFEKTPLIEASQREEFLLIVLAGNMHYVPSHFNDYQDIRILDYIYKELAQAFGITSTEVKEIVRNYQSYFKRINHPSKNTHYAMSKAVFFKYNLNQYQEEYFRQMETPNPIFLKHLDELMGHFLFEWGEIHTRFKIVEG